MRNQYRFAVTMALLGTLNGMVHARDLDKTTRVSLLELYTSEGCNSCPPTDAWVSRLSPQLVPQRLVVLAYHVDYWNYLGWPDRFSQSSFTQRQQASVRYNNLRTAYTPQLLLNGRDHRDRGDIDAQVSRYNAQAARVEIRLNLSPGSAAVMTKVQVKALSNSENEPLVLYLALYENNLHTDVKSGENRGQRLRHDYVVRNLTGPITVPMDKPLHWEGQIALLNEWKYADLGIAAFVQSTKTGAVLQATATAMP